MNSSPDTPVSPAAQSPTSDQVRKILEDARAALNKVFTVPGLTPAQRQQHARGINRGIRRLEYNHQISVLSSRPGMLELPVAGKCNLRCEMCSLSHGSPMYPNWTIEEVERFTPLIQYADAVNPTGAGEPLLVKDFFKMLALFKSNASAVGFYTNATTLTPEKIDRLIELQVNAVNISIDGATKETFERIRKHATFETVVGNARALVRRRKELGAQLPRLQIAMVLMRNNMHELSDLVRLAADIGADSVYTMFVSDLLRDEMPERDPARTNIVLSEAKALAKELGINFFAPALLPENPGDSGVAAEPVMPVVPKQGITCSHPWNQMVVWNDGDVSPCCRIRGTVDDQAFGNIKDAEPAALWNSPGFVRLRERLSTSRPPIECQRCPLRTARIS